MNKDYTELELIEMAKNDRLKELVHNTNGIMPALFLIWITLIVILIGVWHD